ncbi:MAG: DNA polymerase III subunit delta, partial [Rhodospirillales bacterium]|nr:DNA polymerase III subunit delta [Rhodospirillales bacterium]
RSSLRKLFEGADNAAALPCYADEGAGLEALVNEVLREAKLTAEPDAIVYLVQNLGGDRKVSRAELDKLVLYMGDPGRITVEDAAACVGDASGLSMDDLALATAEGDQALVQRVLGKLLLEGTNPVAVLRSIGRHFQRLHLAAGIMANGKSSEQALHALKPPPIFKQADRIRAQLTRWSVERLGTALELLVKAEIDCKTTGMPANEICGRVLMQIARAAGRRR